MTLSASKPVQALLNFEGRVVFVTGARKGIGQSIALRFAEAGADVAVHVRRPGDAAETVRRVEGLGRRAFEAAADLTEEAAVARAWSEAEAGLGRIDVLVNNAGAYPVEPFPAMSAASFDEVVKTNLGTVFRATRVAVDQWKARRQPGVVVNVSSIESARPAVGHAHYSSAKAAVDMLTRSLALELGPLGIRVNAVAPGLVSYPELVELWPEGVARYRERSPLGRVGESQEVADACLFLASPASSWTTGAVLVVDGGVSAAPHF